MIVVGLDPGSAITGYGVVERTGQVYRSLDYGVITAAVPDGGREELGLQAIYRGLSDLLRRHQPDFLAVEKLFFNRNSRTAMAVSQARGVSLLAAADMGIPVQGFSPLEVKMAVTGYGRADKAQVQTMVRVLLGLGEKPRPDDAADALAVALCGHHHSFLPETGVGR